MREDDEFAVDELMARWGENADLIKYRIGVLVHGRLDFVVDGHFTAVESLDKQVEQLEDLLFAVHAPPDGDVQRHNVGLRKSLVHLGRMVLPMRDEMNPPAVRAGADVSVTARMDKVVKTTITTIADDASVSIEYADAVFDEATAFAARRRPTGCPVRWWSVGSRTSTRDRPMGRRRCWTPGASTTYSPRPTRPCWTRWPRTGLILGTWSSSRSTPT